MESNVENASNAGGKESVTQIGAFARRRNPLPDDPPDNDTAAAESTNSVPLHIEQQTSSDAAESPIDLHQRLEWEAILRSYRNTKLLLSSLVEVTPRRTLTLVS